MTHQEETEKETLGLILVTWNRREELRACLDSVLKLQPPPDEIIVVDNHSADGTVAMLKKDFPFVKCIVMPENAGLCQAANVGFATCGCDYVGIIESDMVLSPNWVAATLDAFREDSSLALVCPLFLHIHNDKGGYYNWEDDGDENGYLRFTNGVFTVKKSVFEEAGQTLYAPHYFLYAQEPEISARIINMGYRMKRIKNAATFHNLDATPGSKNIRVSLRRGFFFNMRNNLWNLWTFYSLRNILFFTPLYVLFYIQDAYYIDSRYRGRRNTALESLSDISVFFRAFWDACKGIPTCRKRRKVVDLPHYRNIFDTFRHFRTIQKQRPIYEEAEIVCLDANDFMERFSRKEIR
jgi:hypothetical protein